MTHHSNNSVRDHMKWVSGSLFISRITIMVLVCLPNPDAAAFLCYTHYSTPSLSRGSLCLRSAVAPSFCSDMLFVLPGWVAGLRGSAVQHGPDASQQHPRPEEDDVFPRSRAQGQSREPPDPLAARPQPPWTPGSPWTRPPQPHGPPFSWELSTPGKKENKLDRVTHKAC